MTAEIRVGTCGFSLQQAELFRRFRLLEVQQTFYWPPQPKTLERWRQAAPDDFEFTMKAFQAITHTASSPTYRRAKLRAEQMAQCGHFGDTPMVREACEISRNMAAALRATWVVFQCPPKFRASEETIQQMQQFFHWAPRGNVRFAWEVRHESWTDELIAELCRELDLVHAVDPLERASAYGVPSYWRLHGEALGNYRYKYNRTYSNDELLALYGKCQKGPSGLTYCLFNNMQMAQDAERFQRIVQHGGVIPPG
jgi:uncharacterized protein YecE (DUF72 family)